MKLECKHLSSHEFPDFSIKTHIQTLILSTLTKIAAKIKDDQKYHEVSQNFTNFI